MAADARVAVPRTTLVCADTLNHELAARALRISLAKCRFERALLLTDRPLALPGVDVAIVPRIEGRGGYSRLMLTSLLAHVRTDFALVVQWDGYVLAPRSWTDGFLDYDYVGARWWFRDGRNVGNGGFSLRSRRLLAALAAEAPALEPQEPEDTAICRRLRPLLERKYGIRFAPEHLANRFSIEYVGRNPHPFGFHGLFNMASLVEDREFAWFCERLPESAWTTRDAVRLWMLLGESGRAAQAAQLEQSLKRRYGEAAWPRAVAEAKALAEEWAKVRDRPLPLSPA